MELHGNGTYARCLDCRDRHELSPILEAFEELRSLDLAVCLEPSDNEMQLGAMGSVHATLVFAGRSAHSARPWQGDNALYKAAEFLVDLSKNEPREITIEGHSFKEVMTATLMEGGRARNVSSHADSPGSLTTPTSSVTMT